jgi:hypothetical protein
MNSSNKGFWRNFTWKQFFLFSSVWFATTLLVALVFDYFDPAALVADNLTAKNIVKRIVGSLIIGFILAVWFEPGLDNKKKPQKP